MKPTMGFTSHYRFATFVNLFSNSCPGRVGGPPVSQTLCLVSVGLPPPYPVPPFTEGGQEGNEGRESNDIN